MLSRKALHYGRFREIHYACLGKYIKKLSVNWRQKVKEWECVALLLFVIKLYHVRL